MRRAFLDRLSLAKLTSLILVVLTLPGMRCFNPGGSDDLISLKLACLTYLIGAQASPNEPFQVGHAFVTNNSDETLNLSVSAADPRLSIEPDVVVLLGRQQVRFRVNAIDEITSPLDTSYRVEVDDGNSPKGVLDVATQQVQIETRLIEVKRSVDDLFGVVFNNGTVETARPYAFGLPLGKLRFNSNQLLAPRFPEPVVESVVGVVTQKMLTAQQLEYAQFGQMPELNKGQPLCGTLGPNGLVLCPPMEDPREPGEWIIISQVFDADIPLNDPENDFQYGFVFDSNNTAADNWVAVPQFANDYFQGTDRWYEASYSPENGWQLNVTVVTDPDTNSTESDSSGAFVLIDENAMTLFVPASEFAVENPGYRITSFRHDGKFGQEAPFDWSGDYWPDFEEPLQPVSTIGSAVLF